MTKRGQPRCEDLLCVKAARGFGHILETEETARATLERVRSQSGPNAARITAIMFLLAKCTLDSGIFAVDCGDLSDAVMSLAPDELELPPLPFPSVMLEAAEDETWPVGAGGKIYYRIQQAFIREKQQGAVWEAIIFYQADGVYIEGMPEEPAYAELFQLEVEVTSDQIEFFDTDGESRGVQPSSDVLWRFLVEAIHFITAQGVSLVAITADRAERRRAQRQGWSMPPHLYWVSVNNETQTVIAGSGERNYRYRWIVRGHWRHLTSTTRTWIRPYIKGRPGAPWKGRPVYRVDA